MSTRPKDPLHTKWPGLMGALQKRDFNAAADQVNRRGIQADRNNWAREQMLKAAACQKDSNQEDCFF